MSILTITLSNRDFKLYCPEESHAELYSLAAKLDNEINKVNLLISIYQTSKNAYSNSIVNNLPQKQAAANRKNGIITINDKKYFEEDLSDKLKSDILVFKTINKKLQEFTIELAVLNTSKNVYSNALAQSLEKNK